MNGNRSSRSIREWLWIAILLILLATTFAWFIDPMGKTGTTDERAPVHGLQWMAEPAGPAVQVRLPEAPLATPSPRNSNNGQDAEH